jgi:hypothetical protein
MKKLILLISIMVFAIVSFGQTAPTEVTPDGFISAPVNAYWFGTTSDTLTNAVADTVVIRVKGRKTYDFTIHGYSDFVSGTATQLVKTYASPDGVTYFVTAAGDSTLQSSITADVLNTTPITLDNYNYPYLKIIVTQTGTAVTVPRVYTYVKEN